MISKEDWTDWEEEEEDETCGAAEQNYNNEVILTFFRVRIIISGAGRRGETARPWHV